MRLIPKKLLGPPENVTETAVIHASLLEQRLAGRQGNDADRFLPVLVFDDYQLWVVRRKEDFDIGKSLGTVEGAFGGV